MRLCRSHHPLARQDVVVDKFLRHQPADLGVAVHQRIAIGQRVLPAVLARQIGDDHLDIGMLLAQDLRIAGGLVDGDDPGIAPLLELGDEVLADQPCPRR
jgi:hypothetical protein